MVDAPARSRRRGWLWLALVASLALNSFFLGLALTDFGRDLFSKSHGDRQMRVIQTELRWLRGRLAPDAIAVVEAALAPIQPEMRTRLERLKALRADLDRQAAVPSPDRAAIDALLREIRLEVGAMQDTVQRTTFDALLALPPEARAPLAEPRPERR
ncbi:periplasmic heavy metal sensor [Prosthecomicrobium pneumaticum]|uniref:Periplasmic heavy metal sensor n=1 Tax=Prosthecomicrobium pneumaticum TaxID=81895 RepID=A0A7W9CTQ9_9HYPH|nr:periplasmic heavy metal sensor [Prosthecomicrobium pneumaticum]MBB5751748.1 hypothetical protein [Prosthecomicrobium pneumaticum]